MSQIILIEPVNNEIKTVARAVKIKNTFVDMGFTPRALLKVAGEYDHKYQLATHSDRLRSWWLYRVHDEGINQDMEALIQYLKNE